MKRIIRILFILCLAAMLPLLSACGDSSTLNNTSEAPTAAPVPTAAPEPATAEPTEPAEPEPVATEVPASEPTPDPAAPTEDPSDIISVLTPEETETPLPTTAPTDTPAPATPETTETPAPTRAPRAGDITEHFPDYDTGVDADYSYQSDELRIAIRVYHEIMHYKDRDLPETYYVADIWIRNLNSFRTAFAHGEFNTGDEDGDVLARRENAILAVNGSFNQGLVIRNGELLQGLRKDKGWNSGAACIIYKDGSMKTFKLKRETLYPAREIEQDAWYGWQFGPILIRDYEEFSGATVYGELGYKARNMLGYYEPGHYVIVNCDAYRDDAAGMTAEMMVNVMKSLGVKEAFNLDGGISAAMVFMGEIINHPTPHYTDGQRIEGRELVDMLVFGEYDENGVSPDLSTLHADKFKPVE